MLFEPEQVTDSFGTFSFICLFEITVKEVTLFPHTWTDRPSAELIGNPDPVIVAYIPPPGLVWGGLKVETEIEIV